MALDAIRDADVITIGPGSLYTSILPNLLVSSVPNVIAESRAMKIFIANLMTQPGETDGYDLQQHLDTIKKYAPQIQFDCVIANSRRIKDEQAEIYAADGAYQITPEQFDDMGVPVVLSDLLDQGEMVRHNSALLAQTVLECSERFCWQSKMLATG
jgi:uncharacterized cofD-like protein